MGAADAIDPATLPWADSAPPDDCLLPGNDTAPDNDTVPDNGPLPASGPPETNSTAQPPAVAAAATLLAALSRHGVRQVVLCPGSRSAPLAYAAVRLAARGEVSLHVRIDERSAGFLALGLAKATGEPAAVITTSGTAV
ncbi:MAG: thiamine pyrophosphate-binding protein, partial [Promicromonosporaceae bacterium]|nr:thiamine pyrophosphate-binding protein [Promicromonosporaceae bacterium]